MTGSAEPVVLLFRDDYKRIEDWVLQYPNSETGGQLFGLWTQSKNPYVNIVIGPGKNCRHETHSFHQDLEYLKEVGTFVNKEFMMCHIGEWHSHHRLKLRQPSSGDLNSIWKHFPSGVEHFLLVIATIEFEEVKLWPWLFYASSHTHKAIDVKCIKNDNVFMKDDVVKNCVASGAEPKIPTSTLRLPEKGGKWFDTDWGIHYVQILNSELEKKIADKSTSIKITCDKATQSVLQFSFIRNGFSYALRFSPDFPRGGLAITTPSERAGIKWKVKPTSIESPEEYILQLLQSLRHHIPKR